jgi:hypothetical protein
MKADKQTSKTAAWPVDAEGLPTLDYLNTLNTKAKWDRFWKAADQRSQLRAFIHLTNVMYGEPD